ncbi:MAG: UDP-N-acetylmuramoyl-L-alanine--D-glutamate ligase [Firmicutes bacterium]|nr:UDP-N-acetylmuramoyl-L-alanine--D-glutamate ligase [Bacillota bacterium]
MEWRNRKVAVVGLGVSNRAAIRYLRRRGAHVVGFDQKSEASLGETAQKLREMDVELVLGPDYLSRLDERWDAVFLTPGMPKDKPELDALRQSGVPLLSEIGLVFKLCRAPIVGVTGSSGKTTTTTLIGEMLKSGNRPVYVGGNIGVPLVETVEDIPPDAWVVMELSSFQLEMLDKSPHVAVVTNVTPNHLDVHPSMEAYIDAKRRIYRFQGPSDVAVFNLDDPITAAMAEEAPGRVMGFSRGGRPAAGTWIDDGQIIVQTGPDRGPGAVLRTDELKLLGEHNLENVLAATAVAAACGIEREAIRRVASGFAGVPHRLELVGEWGGVRYYNDSIATSPARAAAGIRAFRQPIVLIAGGYDKRLPFDELVQAAAGRVRVMILLGATAGKIEAAVREHEAQTGAAGPELVRADSLEAAVRAARERARPGEVVLLSPACASYDMFANFEERGRRFREIVRALGSEDTGDWAIPAAGPA